MIKTNAMRLLDQAQIPYSTREYEVDEHDLSGEHVAKQLGLDPDSVFKTLVARGDKNGIHVFCIPAVSYTHLSFPQHPVQQTAWLLWQIP